MHFRDTPLAGAYLIEPEPIHDERGFFARTWSRDEFRERGLVTDLAQCSVSFNHLSGTLRGMHFQVEPHAETKLVRCTAGAIYDVIIDLRPDSPTYCQWYAAELSAANRHMLYIPVGFAHGFITLVDASEVFYQISANYAPAFARGVRWDDPTFGIRWPMPPRVIAERDRTYPDWRP
jgi:dTDP-4-dehydrorhamnose 3,5-epimerase